MKHKCLHIIKIAFGIATVLFLWCCSSDDSTHESVETPMREIHFMLGSCHYQEVTPETGRRANLPEGYVPYSELTPKIPLDGASLRCFMTQATEVKFNGNVSYKSGAWVSKIPLDEGTYYVYGLMPGSEAGKVSLTPQSNDFAHGASMTIQGLNPVTNSDICAIVGVKGSSTAGFADVDVKQGVFEYNAQDGTFIYLLIDHLYAALQLNMNISSEYNALRTIKLTKLTLRSSSVTMTKTLNMTVNLTPNPSNTLPFTAPALSQTTTDAKTVEIYKGEELTLEETDDLVFLACTAPISTNTQFVMSATYNVYDRNGNLIRKDCTAENVLNLPTGGLTRGQKYTFNLTVNPTYLYVLSDPDLDNPTITVN